MFSPEIDSIGSIDIPLSRVPLSIGRVHLRSLMKMPKGQKVIIAETEPGEFKLFSAQIDCDIGNHRDVKHMFADCGIRDENTVGGLGLYIIDGSVLLKGSSTQFKGIPEEIRQRFAHLLLPTLVEILHDDYISLDQNHHSQVENTPTPVGQLHESWLRYKPIRNQAEKEFSNRPDLFEEQRERFIRWKQESSDSLQVPQAESSHSILVP